MAEILGKVGYREVPSSAIEYLELDFDNNFVKITFKSNINVQYCYKNEDLDEFQSAFMELSGKLESEQDRDDTDELVEDINDTIEREDASIGRFINERIRSGNLKLDSRLEQNPDMLARGWDAFTGSTMPEGAVVVGDGGMNFEVESATSSQSGTTSVDIGGPDPIIEELKDKNPHL
tara:strand:+ start:157 stop:687 length:531 start_codon:yes stop_codon:yes gene_type:complete